MKQLWKGIIFFYLNILTHNIQITFLFSFAQEERALIKEQDTFSSAFNRLNKQYQKIKQHSSSIEDILIKLPTIENLKIRQENFYIGSTCYNG